LRNREAARYARWSATAAGLIVLAVIGAYVYRAVQRDRARRGMPAAVPSSVERKSAEFNYKSVEQGRTLFTLRASEVTQFKDHGRALLEDVWITIYGRDGKQNDNIHTRECSYDPQTGGARCQGSVQIEIDSARPSAAVPKNSPLKLVTSDLTFDRETGNASTTAPVKFTFPGGGGSGVGVDYSTRDATVTIERAIQFQLAASEKTAGLPVSASGSSLEFHRDERTAVLNGPVTVQQGDRRLSAQQISVNFDSSNRAREVLVRGPTEIRADENGRPITVSAKQFEALLNPAGWIESISADGNVRGVGKSRGAANNFFAGHVVFAMIPGRNLIKSMTATRDVTAESQQDGQTNTLRTAALRLTFAEPENTTKQAGKAGLGGIGNQQIESAETLAPATIQLVKAGESTRVSAQKFVAKAGRSGRIEKLYGYSGVTIRRQAGGGIPQTISAPQLAATLDPRGGWKTAEASGGVTMQQGDRRAVAQSARMNRAAGAIVLDGSATITDAESRTTARSVSFNQKTGTLRAVGGVISTYAPSGQQNTVNIGTGAAHISADTLTGSESSGHLTYAGHVRLWQGDSVLQANRIDVWRDKKEMQASGNVMAVFPQTTAGPAIPNLAKVSKSSPINPRLWKIRAPLLTYWADQGKAHLQGGVLASSDQGTLHAQTLDVYLSQATAESPGHHPAAGQSPATNLAAGRQLDRVVAQGAVVVEQGNRRGVAEEAQYTAADGKFVLSGGKPTVTDGSNNSASGASLTFYVASDTILVDSQEGSRTLTTHKVEK
jgi:lipopolysaccharide export system protein LptA